MIESHDILAAFSLLTQLPVPVENDRITQRIACATWAYPLVGAFIGLMASLVGAALLSLGIGAGLAAALTLAAMVLITGALHEDGLADCADGFGGGQTVIRRLEIMKDSRIGAYGCVALTIALLARWSGIADLSSGPIILSLVAVGAVSRLPMVLALFLMPNARNTGLAAAVGRPPLSSAVISSGLALTICLLLLGWSGIPVFAVSLIGSLPIFFLARYKIGGHTGDVLGAAQQCAEISALMTATILMV